MSKKPIPLLPPSIKQSRYDTLATLLPPTKSVYIVIGSSFSKVPILNPNSFTNIEFEDLIEWTGGIIIQEF